MSHHLEAPGTDSIDDLGSFFEVGNLELLLEKDGRLLVRGLDNARNEDMVWRG